MLPHEGFSWLLWLAGHGNGANGKVQNKGRTGVVLHVVMFSRSTTSDFILNPSSATELRDGAMRSPSRSATKRMCKENVQREEPPPRMTCPPSAPPPYFLVSLKDFQRKTGMCLGALLQLKMSLKLKSCHPAPCLRNGALSSPRSTG
jgi:hypothetical protein